MKFFYLLTVLLPTLALAQSNAPKKLRCEHEVQPLGLDERQPRLSWQGSATNRGARQTAYQVLVASDEKKLTANQGDVWDSGKITSDQSVFIDYAGKALQPRQRVFWKVKTWDETGKASAWSAPAGWEMALFDKSQWKADLTCATVSLNASMSYLGGFCRSCSMT
ncbi:MAG: hypothetical protein H7Y12_12185 [Sphingobacteriaceae bacterium]|nr:hypothetical protein [Cytophagaceae bacterium]